MNAFRIAYVLLACCAALLFSCQTNDVDYIAQVTFSASEATVAEDTGQIELIISIPEASTEDVVGTFTTSGTATFQSDYTLSSNDIMIPAGQLEARVTLTVLADTVKEDNETATISLEMLEGGFLSGASEVNVVIIDNDQGGSQGFVIILNEICYDPSNNALDGDTNGDGQYAQAEDEFLEFVNISNQPADVSGFKVYDAEALIAGTPRHVIPSGTIIPPGKAMVIFGGGTPTGTFGGAIVQTSTTGNMNLNNAGDIMTFTDADDNVIIEFDIEPLSNNPNESYTRNPDITGDFEQHGDNTPILFSPGTKVDGTPF